MKDPKAAATVVRSPTSINVDRAVWRAFKMECAKDGRTVTEQVERLIKVWIAAKKQTPKQRA